MTEENTGTTKDAQGADEIDTTPEGADNLGDPGKRALDAMKTKWHAARDRVKELEAQMAEAAKPQASDGDESEIKALRAELAAQREKALKSDLRAAAKGKVEDVGLAMRLIDLSAVEDAEGAIDALLEEFPSLAAKPAQRFAGTADNGAARKASGPSQLSREDLKGMSPEAIVKAKSEGRLKDLMGGNA